MELLKPWYTKAGLPPVGKTGRIARVTDDIRGLWMDNGSAWAHLFGEVIDAKRDFQCKGDDVTDDQANMQLAIDALG